jgi:hypothetical protein
MILVWSRKSESCLRNSKNSNVKDEHSGRYRNHANTVILSSYYFNNNTSKSLLIQQWGSSQKE